MNVFVQTTANLRNCPGCGFDLRGEPIPEKYFEHDLESEEHKASVESCKRWGSPGNNKEGCFCLPYGDKDPEDRFYWKTIGVEISGAYDGILFWMCPSCGGQWHRWQMPDMQVRALAHMTHPIPLAA